jgi:hypothetical protein
MEGIRTMSTHDWWLASPEDVERKTFTMPHEDVKLTVMYERFANHPDRLTIEAYVEGEYVTSREIAVYRGGDDLLAIEDEGE